MKRFRPIITFFAGCGFILLIGAKNQSAPAIETPRYHVTWLGNSFEGLVYDAVTGEVRTVGISKVKNSKNLKDILDEPKK